MGPAFFLVPWPKQKDEKRVRVENTGGNKSQCENQRFRGEKGAFFSHLGRKKESRCEKKQGGKRILPIWMDLVGPVFVMRDDACFCCLFCSGGGWGGVLDGGGFS